MKTRSLLFIGLAVVLVSSWLCVVLYPSLQNFMPGNLYWNGVSGFAGRFNAGVSPVAAGPGPDPAAQATIVVPYTAFSDTDLTQLVDFVNNGGTLLVMDDFGYGNQVLHALGLGMVFAGTPLLDPYINYRNQFFPIITDFSPELKNAGIKQVVLNHATALSFTGNDTGRYDILARSADTSFKDFNGNGVWDPGEPKGPFPVAALTPVGNGTVIAVSDPSIIINSMAGMRDNEKFVAQLVSASGRQVHVVLDTSHLPKSPLDSSKEQWAAVRKGLLSPSLQVLLVAAAVALSFISLTRKES
jgi:hypothetical protein